ncbi:MAG: hypothetical protein ABWY49_01650 [Rhizobium sp.]
MFTLSNVPFVGLGFLVVGFVGFLVMAIVLDDHSTLFTVIFCWYALMIPCAAFALSKDVRQSGRRSLRG